MKVKIDKNEPIHLQVELCLERREVDGRRCSRPKDHSVDLPHHYSMVFSKRSPQKVLADLRKLNEEAERIDREAAQTLRKLNEEAERIDREVAQTTTVSDIHLLVSDVGTLACGVPLGVGNGNFRKVTTDPDRATCRTCEIEWLRYERDQYKEMWQKNEGLAAEYASLKAGIAEDERVRAEHGWRKMKMTMSGFESWQWTTGPVCHKALKYSTKPACDTVPKRHDLMAVMIEDVDCYDCIQKEKNK
jgi:hypothetical protein